MSIYQRAYVAIAKDPLALLFLGTPQMPGNDSRLFLKVRYCLEGWPPGA